MYDLYIGNKNYSSWSLRPWVLMRELALPFREHLMPFGGSADPAAFKRFSPTGKVPCLVDGEIIQLRGRTELDVSEATYERILLDKTASLFAWATRTGAAVAGASEAEQAHLADFGERLGFAFQLVDDVIDYAGEKSGKTLLADLREGKLTLPLVLTVEKQPELIRELRRIYAGDAEPVEAVSAAVRESGACDEVRLRAREYTRLGLEALRSIPASPARGLLEQVAIELTARAG